MVPNDPLLYNSQTYKVNALVYEKLVIAISLKPLEVET